MMRPPSPTRADAIQMALKPITEYAEGVLTGNWIEKKAEREFVDTPYWPPQKSYDPNKFKPETRSQDFGANKLNGSQGSINVVIVHDHEKNCRSNFTTTNDLIYNHFPKPLCGPSLRRYRSIKRTFVPEANLLKCYDNLTTWGLLDAKKYEWKCSVVSDYISTCVQDHYTPPGNDAIPKCRYPKNSLFTKTFKASHLKPIKNPTAKNRKSKIISQ